jgi:outer membrane protein assembly factor BamB
MAKGMMGDTAFWRGLIPALVFLGAVATVAASARQRQNDWPQFGWDLASSSAPTTPTGITARNISSLVRRQVKLDGTVDASAIYLQAVMVKGSKHDVFFVTTSYGKTIAIDARQGTVLWEYAPPTCASLQGTRQITNSTPVADPDRHYIYAASPDGTIEKLAISDGHLLWKTPITLRPEREKISSPLKYFRGRIIAVTGGFYDRPPYQGHVAILDAQTGRLLHVWNSLCSNRSGLLDPSSCTVVRSAIWGRAGAVIDAATGDIFVATGNGPYDGKTNWGSATVELNPDATRVLANYTPKDSAQLNAHDEDLGTISPALLGNGLIAQGGKDGLIRLLSTKAIAGDAPHIGHELQVAAMPSKAEMYGALAVWRHSGQTWVFAANIAGDAAWRIESGRLVEAWKNSNAGTSPVVAGGLLYIYDPKGGLRVYNPTEGTQIVDLPCGSGHWNSPIVVDGKIALPEGDANEHASKGILDIWSLPTKH